MKRLAIILALAAVAACGGKKDAGNNKEPIGSNTANPMSKPAGSGAAGSAAAGSAAATTPASGSATAAATPAAGSAVDVPVATDFEATAKTSITDKNLSTELTTMESELQQ